VVDTTKGYQVSIVELDFLGTYNRYSEEIVFNTQLLNSVKAKGPTRFCDLDGVKSINLFENPEKTAHFICLPQITGERPESCRLFFLHDQMRHTKSLSPEKLSLQYALKITPKISILVDRLDKGTYWCSDGLRTYSIKIDKMANDEENKLLTNDDLETIKTQYASRERLPI